MPDLPGGDAAPEEDLPVLQRSRRVRGVQAQVQYSAVQVQYSTVQYRLASCPYCRLRFSEATVTRNILAETTS